MVYKSNHTRTNYCALFDIRKHFNQEAIEVQILSFN